MLIHASENGEWWLLWFEFHLQFDEDESYVKKDYLFRNYVQIERPMIIMNKLLKYYVGFWTNWTLYKLQALVSVEVDIRVDMKSYVH